MTVAVEVLLVLIIFLFVILSPQFLFAAYLDSLLCVPYCILWSCTAPHTGRDRVCKCTQGRFLPDKAIDLVDEACANKRVQLESVPEEIDNLLRQKYRLQVPLAPSVGWPETRP